MVLSSNNNQIDLFDLEIGLQPWVTMDIGVMPIEEYSTLFKYSEPDPPNQIQFSVIPRTPVLADFLLLYWEYIQCIFRQGDLQSLIIFKY